MSFNFKLLHGLLPVKDRINKIIPSSPAQCSLCSLASEESIQHALISCPFNQDVFGALVKVVRMVVPNIGNEELLRFDFQEVSQSLEFPVMFLVSTFLLEIWSRRMKKARISLYDIRSTIEAKCALLRETRYQDSCTSIQDMLNNL